MWFVLGLIGALFGVAFEGIDAGFNALATGFVVGALLGSIVQLKTRVAKLEAAIAERPRVASPTPAGAKASPEVPDAPPAALVAAPAPLVTAAAAPTPPAPAVDAATAARVAQAARRVMGDAPAAASASAPPRWPPNPEVKDAPRARADTVDDDDPFVRFGASVKSWFTEGNLPAKIGMLVLFVGVSALLKYAFDEGLLTLSIPTRFLIVTALALLGLGFGWWKRNDRPGFALALQGGSLGILLLTTFAAYRLYQLLSPTTAFAAVVALVAVSAVLAVRQHASILAVLGFVGGYLAPVLISTGSGDHVALFTYYAILNAAVFGVASIRPWRALNLVGFAFTFVVGILWGREYYRPELFATVEPFLVLFFLFYVGIAVLYALRSPGRTGAVDGTLLFGTPLIAFGLQNALVDDLDVLALSAVAVAALYGALFAWLRRRDGFELLSQAFAALALGFATLAIPLAFAAETTAVAWALEGVAIVWLGVRQDRMLMRLAGTLLQWLASGAFAWFLFERNHAFDSTLAPIANGPFVAGMLVAAAAAVSAWLLDRAKRDALLSILLLIGAASWWSIVGLREISLHVDPGHEANAVVAFAALTMLLAATVHRVTQWPRVGAIAIVVFALAWPLAGYANAENDGPLSNAGWMAWLAFLVAARLSLALLRTPRIRGLGWAHVVELLTLPLLLGLQANEYALDRDFGDGLRAALSIAPLLIVTLLAAAIPRVTAAPLSDEFPIYRGRFFALAAFATIGWWFTTLLLEGVPSPLAYWPVLNPLEFAQLAAIGVTLFVAARGGFGPNLAMRDLKLAAIGATFAWLTVATLRGVHFLTGAPWSEALLDSRVAQTSLTIVWSLVGVVALLAGSKRASRPLWMGGAALMGAVLVKLLLIDRRYTGDVEGIVSFIGVGLLLTAVGWFAPSPPKLKPPAEGAA